MALERVRSEIVGRTDMAVHKSELGWLQKLARKRFRRNRGSLSLRLRLTWRDLLGSAMDGRAKRSLKGGRYAIVKGMPKGGRGVEVGVWKGDFSASLLTHLTPSHLTLVDPWAHPTDGSSPFPRSASGDPLGVDGRSVAGQSDADRVYEYVAERFAGCNSVGIDRRASTNAATDVDDASLDWVYLDGSHLYQDVSADLAAWSGKIGPGGVLFGDDYYWRDPEGQYSVKRAVDEFVSASRPKAWVAFRGQFMILLA